MNGPVMLRAPSWVMSEKALVTPIARTKRRADFWRMPLGSVGEACGEVEGGMVVMSAG